MIVFMDNINLINDLCYKFPNRNINILNLSSLYSGYDSISDLIKISNINNTAMSMPEFVNSIGFDIQYAINIINNPQMFNSFMKIMSSAYEGDLVIILVYRDLYRDAIMESLIKFIQQRYGYNCWIVEISSDIDYVKEETFVPNGLLVLGEDIRRYDESYRDIRNQISIE